MDLDKLGTSVLCGLGGAWMILSGIVPFYHSMASQDWPSTEGFVDKIEVIKTEDTSDEKPSYSPNIKYHFTVEGEHYSGSRVYIGQGNIQYNDYQQAVRVLTPYFKDDSLINIHFDPDNPSINVVESGFSDHGGGFIKIILGPILLLVSLGFYRA